MLCQLNNKAAFIKDVAMGGMGARNESLQDAVQSNIVPISSSTSENSATSSPSPHHQRPLEEMMEGLSINDEKGPDFKPDQGHTRPGRPYPNPVTCSASIVTSDSVSNILDHATSSSFSRYRDPASHARLFCKKNADPASSLPGLSEDSDEQVFAPKPAFWSKGQDIRILCQLMASLTLTDKSPLASSSGTTSEKHVDLVMESVSDLCEDPASLFLSAAPSASSIQPAEERTATQFETAIVTSKSPGTFGTGKPAPAQPARNVAVKVTSFTPSKAQGSFSLSKSNAKQVTATGPVTPSITPNSAMPSAEAQRSSLPLSTSGTCTKGSKAQGRRFRERDANSRQELELLVASDKVPGIYKAKVQAVIESPLCDEVSAKSHSTVSTIPELVDVGAGAAVAAVASVGKILSKGQFKQELEFFRNLRNAYPLVWSVLITVTLQSGRTPQDVLGDANTEVLGCEWAVDYRRLDKLSRNDTSADSEAFFTHAEIPMSIRPLFDQAQSKITSGSRQIFEQAVKQWAKDRQSNGNRGMFIKCLRKAGWIEADSEYTRFVRWSTELAPMPIRRACHGHFRWAYPRLHYAVASERMAKMIDLEHVR